MPSSHSPVAGRYRLGGLLGRGGMAEVHAAFDERLQRPVALKRLRPELATRPDVVARFVREARAAAGLSHPNIVAVYDSGRDERGPFLVMERLDGGSLADRLAAGSPADDEIVEVAADVASALAAAHAAGIVHRDVKPGNILFGAGGRAKVADFGIATSTDGGGDLTSTGTLLGTPAYLAPERIDGAPATPTADVYAVGVLLYEALAGQKPFAGDTPGGVAYAVRHQPPTPLRELRPDLPDRVVALVEQAMARHPEHRFADGGALATALGTIGRPASGLGGAPATATMALPAPGFTSGRRPSRERRRVAVAAVAGLVVLLGLLMGATALGSAPDDPVLGPAVSPSGPEPPPTTPTTAVDAAAEGREGPRRGGRGRDRGEQADDRRGDGEKHDEGDDEGDDGD